MTTHTALCTTLKSVLVPAILLAGLALPGLAAADPEKGMAALEAGDYKTALAELNADAKKGDLDAMFMLSRLYAEGKGVKQDLKIAFQWMEKAAKGGSTRAEGSLAMYYSEGIGTSRDDAKSLEFALRAAEKGDPISQFIMGMRYNTGTGVTRDPAQAEKWWARAADRGMRRAQVVLANALSERAATGGLAQTEAGLLRVEAAKWFMVSGSDQLPGAEKLLPNLKERMTPEEITAAEGKARDWKPSEATR
jgi:TPR repeat protein